MFKKAEWGSQSLLSTRVMVLFCLSTLRNYLPLHSTPQNQTLQPAILAGAFYILLFPQAENCYINGSRKRTLLVSPKQNVNHGCHCYLSASWYVETSSHPHQTEKIFSIFKVYQCLVKCRFFVSIVNRDGFVYLKTCDYPHCQTCLSYKSIFLDAYFHIFKQMLVKSTVLQIENIINMF